MREAKRDLQRSQAKLAKLTEANDSANERSAAFNQFWNTLVEDLRLLVNDDQLPPEHKSALLDAIPLTSQSPVISAFSESLQERNTSFKAVLSRIASLGSKSTPEVDQLQARCHRLGEESASLKSKLTLAIQDKETLTEELTVTIEQLRRAERKFDRWHSATVKATERPGEQAEEEADKAKVEAANVEKQVAMQKKERAEKEMQDGNGPSNGHLVGGGASSEELEEFRRLAESRLAECDRWRSEVIALREETEEVKRTVQQSLDARLLETPLYQDIHRHFEEAKKQKDRIESVNQRIEAENNELREARIEFERATKAEASAQIDSLRNTVKVHEADSNRLRGARDKLTSDLNDFKQRDAIRFSQIDEMKAMVQSKDKRIEALRSEVRRLQLSLALKGGNVELADKLKAGLDDKEARKREEDDIEMIEALQDRLKAAQETSSNLKRQLDARSSTTTEQDLLDKVASLQGELDQLTAILTSVGTDEAITADEVRGRLVGQAEEIAGLKREVASAQTISNALCDEVDTIQEAYNQSQKVALERITEVAKMENKILRLMTEKSKADSKYYEAMRTKDNIETEGRAQTRNLERQAKVIEGYQEVERTFQSHTKQCEAELTQLRSVVAQQNTALLAMQETLEGAQRRAASAQSAQQEAEATSSRRNAEYIEESRLRQDLQEKYDKSNRELDRCKKQLASSGESSRKKSVSGGDDVQIEYLQALLRCSACKERYRDRIITRCLHTFCQDCVDARIQTRQRKCPHCGLGFSTSDVQTLFLQ